MLPNLLTRRTMLTGLGASMLVPHMLRAQSAQARAPFSVPPLPYAYDALAPVIDARTMEIHHGRHHRAYVDNLNRIVGDTPALRGMGLDALVARAGSLPAAVRNNAGGHWNHSFFWESMTAPDRGGAPDGALLSAIRGAFGSLDAMKTAFDAAGTSRFGSGWAWLILGRDGRLAVASTSNQDNPLMDVAETKGVPLLGNDLWEHAYYLTYQNRRGDYLREWWRVVDWSVVSRRLDQAGI